MTLVVTGTTLEQFAGYTNTSLLGSMPNSNDIYIPGANIDQYIKSLSEAKAEEHVGNLDPNRSQILMKTAAFFGRLTGLDRIAVLSHSIAIERELKRALNDESPDLNYLQRVGLDAVQNPALINSVVNSLFLERAIDEKMSSGQLPGLQEITIDNQTLSSELNVQQQFSNTTLEQSILLALKNLVIKQQTELRRTDVNITLALPNFDHVDLLSLYNRAIRNGSDLKIQILESKGFIKRKYTPQVLAWFLGDFGSDFREGRIASASGKTLLGNIVSSTILATAAYVTFSIPKIINSGIAAINPLAAMATAAVIGAVKTTATSSNELSRQDTNVSLYGNNYASQRGKLLSNAGQRYRNTFEYNQLFFNNNVDALKRDLLAATNANDVHETLAQAYAAMKYDHEDVNTFFGSGIFNSKLLTLQQIIYQKISNPLFDLNQFASHIGDKEQKLDELTEKLRKSRNKHILIDVARAAVFSLVGSGAFIAGKSLLYNLFNSSPTAKTGELIDSNNNDRRTDIALERPMRSVSIDDKTLEIPANLSIKDNDSHFTLRDHTGYAVDISKTSEGRIDFSDPDFKTIIERNGAEVTYSEAQYLEQSVSVSTQDHFEAITNGSTNSSLTNLKVIDGNTVVDGWIDGPKLGNQGLDLNIYTRDANDQLHLVETINGSLNRKLIPGEFLELKPNEELLSTIDNAGVTPNAESYSQIANEIAPGNSARTNVQIFRSYSNDDTNNPSNTIVTSTDLNLTDGKVLLDSEKANDLISGKGRLGLMFDGHCDETITSVPVDTPESKVIQKILLKPTEIQITPHTYRIDLPNIPTFKTELRSSSFRWLQAMVYTLSPLDQLQSKNPFNTQNLGVYAPLIRNKQGFVQGRVDYRHGYDIQQTSNNSDENHSKRTNIFSRKNNTNKKQAKKRPAILNLFLSFISDFMSPRVENIKRKSFANA